MSSRLFAASEVVIADVKRELADYLSGRPEIVFAILYGSAAEGRPFHDVDVAVYVDESQWVGQDRYAYIFMLADALAQCIPYPVDVRLIKDAPLPFRYNISRGQPIFARDPAALADFLSRTSLSSIEDDMRAVLDCLQLG
ncbi:MAG: hypothetical protein KatS3mg053_0540 [Candidatus Roseilinea sp.]|nr:MAG: hypothetical protein KatS3mg053_0540 [Candidatus Roseilinea sp.]